MKFKEFLEVAKLLVFHIGFQKPSLFFALKYMNDQKAIELIDKHDLITKNLLAINNQEKIDGLDKDVLSSVFNSCQYKVFEKIIAHPQVSISSLSSQCLKDVILFKFLQRDKNETTFSNILTILSHKDKPDYSKQEMSDLFSTTLTASQDKETTIKIIKILDIDNINNKDNVFNSQKALEVLIKKYNNGPIKDFNIKAILDTCHFAQTTLEKALLQVPEDSIIKTLIQEKIIEYEATQLDNIISKAKISNKNKSKL